MTREEKIDWLCRLRADLNNGVIFTPWNKEFTEAITGILEQEPDDYIRVPKEAVKYVTAGMVAYNAEWLKNHFDIERSVICGESYEDTVSREVYNQIVRERDIAIEQLNELGYEFGERIEQEPLEVEAIKSQQAYNKGFEDCRRAVLKQLKGCLTGGDAEYNYVKIHIDSILPVNLQEPITDRIEYGTDGNTYRLTISNGKEFEQDPKMGKVIKMRDATPEEREAVDKYIKSISKTTGVNFWDIEQEPCEDAINPNQSKACSILDDECPYPHKHCWECQLNYQYELAKHESVKPQKPKIGHWITTRTLMHDGEYYCDICKCDAPNNEKLDYCPNCKAKMQE